MERKKRINSRRKGYRIEHLLEQKLRERGFKAYRVPLSGAVEGFQGDVVCEGLKIQVKGRNNGFNTLYKFLEGFDILAVKKDREDFLFVVPFDLFSQLLSAFLNSKKGKE